jgi:ESCRT-II complex subunit VPS36
VPDTLQLPGPLQAVQSFPAAGVQLRLRQFASGVTVVQGPQHSDAQVCSRLAQLVAPPAGGGLGKGITTTDAAAALQVPLGIAAEHLLLAEARGVLVRDDSPSGLCFFRNFFVEV